jgi:hypothetical protein
MTATAYVNNVYKLYKNNKLGICENINLTYPNMCITDYDVNPTQTDCTILLTPYLCDLTITEL